MVGEKSLFYIYSLSRAGYSNSFGMLEGGCAGKRMWHATADSRNRGEAGRYQPRVLFHRGDAKMSLFTTLTSVALEQGGNGPRTHSQANYYLVFFGTDGEIVTTCCSFVADEPDTRSNSRRPHLHSTPTPETA